MKIEIDIPEGYEVDTENSTKECIKLKKIENKLPKTWEEFCKIHPRKACEGYISVNSTCNVISGYTVDIPNKELAEAMLALCQLIQLRDCYNDGWKPGWTEANVKYVIISCKNELIIDTAWSNNRILTFKTAELRDQFLKNFKDLIEIAKPLI